MTTVPLSPARKAPTAPTAPSTPEGSAVPAAPVPPPTPATAPRHGGAPTPGHGGTPAPGDALSVWPASTVEEPHGRLLVGGVPLAEIAEGHGTPAYVLDEAEVRERCRTYRNAFPDAEIHYAAKAFLCRALVHWVEEEGLGLDVCSAGELELAVTTGFPDRKSVV